MRLLVGAKVRWGRVVCDEAQAIKNHLSQQAKAVRALPAASRIALTGTPVENQLSELWSIMEFANPGLLGSAKAFRERYAVPVERHGSAEAAQELRRITEPFVLRRLKTDKTIISDLPEKQEMRVWCNLTQEQASLYAATVTDMMSRIEDADSDMSRRGLVLAAMAKLKQVCNHPAHLLGDGSRLEGRSGKLARLEEICEADRRRGRPGALLHPVRRVRPDAAAVPLAAADRLPGALPCTAGALSPGRRSSGTRWSSGSRRRTARCCSCCRSRPGAPGST